MANILIAGCGDVGQRTAQQLLQQGHRVTALRRQPPQKTVPALEWVFADLLQVESLNGLRHRFDTLIYTATPGARNEAAYRAIFISGLQHAVAALGDTLQRVVFASSSAVYGEHEGAWVDETTPTQPLGYNGRVLLEAEAWLTTLSVSTRILRLAGLYGPGRWQLFERLGAGQARAPHTPPHWANRIHVEDAAAALAHLCLLNQGEGVYIGCDDTPLPLHELYGELAAQLGAPAVVEGPAPANVGSKRLSNRRLRASGLELRWPDSRQGYQALIQEFFQRSGPDPSSGSGSGSGSDSSSNSDSGSGSAFDLNRSATESSR